MNKFTFALALLALTGCGGGSSNKQTPVSRTGSARPDDVNGATLTGRVTFSGTPPVMRAIDMSANPACMRAHANSPAKSEEVMVGAGGGLKNVFVWVKSGVPDIGWAAPATPVLLDQVGCVYAPHVAGVMTGQEIEIKNSDPTNHNIHSRSETQPFNESQPPGSEDRRKSFARPEVMVPIKCNVHPWMQAYIGVVSHPFFAVTGDDGAFSIKGLPPGTYTVETWHEKYGRQEQRVTVGAKDAKTLDFSYKG